MARQPKEKPTTVTTDLLQTRVGAVVVAQLLGLTTRRLQQFVDEGVMARVGRGEYILADVVGAYVGFLRGERKDNTKTQHQNRVADARTREIELRTAERLKELAPMAEAEALAMEIVGAVMSAVMTIPARWTSDQGERARLETLVDKIRGEVALSVEKVRAAYSAAADEPDPATDEDDS